MGFKKRARRKSRDLAPVDEVLRIFKRRPFLLSEYYFLPIQTSSTGSKLAKDVFRLKVCPIDHLVSRWTV
jgi:hypothetical protein